MTRWAHQSGFHVERRFGWDCHGLPVEFEIDKELNIKGPEDVIKMGIDVYNKKCRSIVMKYSNEWINIVTRLGRWIDFENDYKTLYPSFMESVWWVFKQLYSRGLVYKGVKVMPYSTACNTPLSNFESSQNYKEVVDTTVVVSFPLEENPTVSLVAWTTTPWTLVSNLALCVNPHFDYVKVEELQSKNIYILMEARLHELFKKPEEYKILERFKGKTLENKTYQPLFPYFLSYKQNGAFRVLCDTYVTADSGTGVVHQAPYFGQDDYRVCLAYKIISKEGKLVCPLDDNGRFIDPVKEFKGQFIKDADKNIIKYLKTNLKRLVHQSTIKHNYPFCWRSDTPLIYRAVPSWFIRVQQANQLLLQNNQKIYWVPDFVKEKRFANWLKDAHDWAVSRNRYWGTPIPLWISEDGEEVVCIGSIAELEDLANCKVTDLHREHVDKIMIPSKLGKGQLRRVNDVFDCWFESGSMPYAQAHYPFENRKQFDENFPADFIAEGVDQTRGWFYTLLVLSTLLFNKPPFKNLIVNGLVLASDGQKMSKRKKNYPDPMSVVLNYGSDALRLYLINSPVVRAENLRFKEEGVRDILKDVFLPWYNAYRFLIQNVISFQMKNSTTFEIKSSQVFISKNPMDKWMLSFTQSLIKFVNQEMKMYRLYTVIPRLIEFIENLTNWYVKMNRKRLKGEEGKEDCQLALETLTRVLLSIVQLMAPFTPFLTESMYQNLKYLFEAQERADSVHYLMLPEVQTWFIDQEVENKIVWMQKVIEIGRILRDRKTLPLKYPLAEIIIIGKNEGVLNGIKSLEKYILKELNVRKLTLTTDKEKYGLELKANPNIKALGIRLRDKSKQIISAIRELNDTQLQEYQKNPNLFTICDTTLEPGDICLTYKFGGDISENLDERFIASSDGDILVILDCKQDEFMLNEGLAREMINRIQKLRKKAKLVPTDAIEIFFHVSDSELAKILESNKSFLVKALGAQIESFEPGRQFQDICIREKQEFKNGTLDVVITRPEIRLKLESNPVCKYVNLVLIDKVNGVKKGTLLLENPLNQNFISNQQSFSNLVKVIFDLSCQVYIFDGQSCSQINLSTSQDILKYSKKMLIVTTSLFDGLNESLKKISQSLSSFNQPFSKFINLEQIASHPQQSNVNKATILLENSSNLSKLDLNNFNRLVSK